jgi:hypothetical protein
MHECGKKQATILYKSSCSANSFPIGFLIPGHCERFLGKIAATKKKHIDSELDVPSNVKFLSVRHHVTCFWAFFVEHHLSMMHELLWCYAP